MNMNLRALTLAAALCVVLFTVNAADTHAHKATPRGGRLLDKTDPSAEFVVEKDRAVTINFYSEEMKERLFQDWVKEILRKDGEDPLRRLQVDVANLDPLSQMLYIDTRANLPDDLLMVYQEFQSS